MKRVLVIPCLACLCGLVLTGCGGRPTPTSETAPGGGVRRQASGPEPGGEYPRPAQPSRSYTIGVVVPHLSNPHFVGQSYGYIDEAEALGARVTLLEAGGYQYLDKQISQVEDLIASRVDAIVLVAVSGPGTVGVVDRAVAAGIPVINCNVM